MALCSYHDSQSGTASQLFKNKTSLEVQRFLYCDNGGGNQIWWTCESKHGDLPKTVSISELLANQDSNARNEITSFRVVKPTKKN